MAKTYTTISVNSSVWTSIPKWTLVAKISGRRRSNNHDSNPFFNCNSFRTHQVGTPTSNLPNLVGQFTFHTAFISRQKWTENAYLCQIFLPKRGQLSPFYIRIAGQNRSQPKFEFYRPVLTLMDSLYLLMSQGVVNLLILGISCSFMRSTPVPKREGSSTH